MIPRFVYAKRGTETFYFYVFGSEQDKNTDFIFSDRIVKGDEAIKYADKYMEASPVWKRVHARMPWISGDIKFLESAYEKCYTGIKSCAILLTANAVYEGMHVPEKSIPSMYIDNTSLFPILNKDLTPEYNSMRNASHIVHEYIMYGYYSACIVEGNDFIIIRYDDCSVVYKAPKFKEKKETYRETEGRKQRCIEY